MSAFLDEITGIFSYIDMDLTKVKAKQDRTNAITDFGISVCVCAKSNGNKPSVQKVKFIDFKERKFIYSLCVHLE